MMARMMIRWIGWSKPSNMYFPRFRIANCPFDRSKPIERSPMKLYAK
jgi:hypothetical protein